MDVALKVGCPSKRRKWDVFASSLFKGEEIQPKTSFFSSGKFFFFFFLNYVSSLKCLISWFGHGSI